MSDAMKLDPLDGVFLVSGRLRDGAITSTETGARYLVSDTSHMRDQPCETARLLRGARAADPFDPMPA